MLLRIRFVIGALLVVCYAIPFTAADGPVPSGPPPVPPIESVSDIGTVVQNSNVAGRDGNFSALLLGQSVWTFGDTSMTVPGVNGRNWDDNSLAWTAKLDASHGIKLEHDLLDSTGAPGEYLPLTPWELQYNNTHDSRNCTAQPCGSEYALWGGPVVADPLRNRALFFYDEIYRVSGQAGWTNIGAGIAVGTPDRKFVRPQNGSDTPNMWGPNEVAYAGGSLVVGTTMYSYGCVAGFLVMHCRVARVTLADALDKSRWTYYAGSGMWSANPSAAVVVFDGGAAGNSVFYSPYLGMYVAIYSGVFSNNVYYRVSWTPWGPWSDQTFLFTGRQGWNDNADYAALAHPEFAQESGRIQYVTYAHTYGFLRQNLPIVRVVFGNPAQ